MTSSLPIEGFAAIYDEPDIAGDVVAPGAFRRTLRDAPRSVKMLAHHNAEAVVGRWLRFEERRRGLYAFGEILPVTQAARDAAALVEIGELNGLSIGYKTVKAERRGRHLAGAGRRIVAADLWEISIVTFPMAPKARLIAGKERPHQDANLIAFADHVRRAATILSA